jgi:hypothetical protein
MQDRFAVVFSAEKACVKLSSLSVNGLKPALNTSSARRKMWGEDGNDARFIKLNRWY